MRITSVNNQNITAPGQQSRKPHQSAADEDARNIATTSGSRALILVSPVQSNSSAQTVTRQAANFLAHLIATKHALPQARERRRIEPEIATAIYAAASNRTPAVTGCALSQAV